MPKVLMMLIINFDYPLLIKNIRDPTNHVVPYYCVLRCVADINRGFKQI